MSINSKPKAATQAKKRWNKEHYTAIKVSASPDLAAAFKAACAAADVSMNGMLTQFMVEYSNVAMKQKSKTDYSTRRQRRAALKRCVLQLEQIRDAEELCRDNTPVNLQGSSVYEKADEYVSMLNDALELLESVY